MNMSNKTRAIWYLTLAMIISFFLPAFLFSVFPMSDIGSINFDNSYIVQIIASIPKIFLILWFFHIVKESFDDLPLFKVYWILIIVILSFTTFEYLVKWTLIDNVAFYDFIYSVLGIFYNFIGLFLLLYSFVVFITKYADLRIKIVVLFTTISLLLSTSYLSNALLDHLLYLYNPELTGLFISQFTGVLFLIQVMMYCTQTFVIYKEKDQVSE